MPRGSAPLNSFSTASTGSVRMTKPAHRSLHAGSSRRDAAAALPPRSRPSRRAPLPSPRRRPTTTTTSGGATTVATTLSPRGAPRGASPISAPTRRRGRRCSSSRCALPAQGALAGAHGGARSSASTLVFAVGRLCSLRRLLVVAVVVIASVRVWLRLRRFRLCFTVAGVLWLAVVALL